jgi:hypothetical protein
LRLIRGHSIAHFGPFRPLGPFPFIKPNQTQSNRIKPMNPTHPPHPSGKISGLPHHIREQVHSRLRDGQSGGQIVAWLNSLPEVNALLASAYGGRPISPQNLSEWKIRAHTSWLLRQDALAQAPRLLAQSRQLSQAGQGEITDHLATVVAASYALATERLADVADAGPHWRFLRELCRDVVGLRRRDQSAQWLRLQSLQMGISPPNLPPPIPKGPNTK